MRIAHVANFYGPTSGGLRTAMHALGAGYREHGHDFLMVVPGPRHDDEQTEFGRRLTVRAPRIPGSGGYRVILRTRRVRRLLADYAPDCVEVSDRTTLRGLGRWARRRGATSVFFSHERADGVLRAHLPRWLARMLPLTALADWHNRGTSRRFTTVVCTTAYAAEEFDRIGRPTRRVALGVDLERFHPSRHDGRLRARHAGPREHLVVMASRLSREKRPELAVDAARLLAERGLPVRLVSAGTGAAAERVRARAEGGPVEFLGFVADRGEYAALLATADALVAPGPIETFGLAALEALASGTPVVVNARSALPEVVGDAGAIADDDPEAFARALAEVLARPERERRRRARQRAEHFPWSTTVEAMLELHSRTHARAGTADLPEGAR